MLDRSLAWDGCVNVRDLGGFPTEDGAETRWGRIIRADSVRSLSEPGWKALAEHGVRTVVDLRSYGELARDKPVEAPVEAVHISVMAEHDDPVWQEIDELAERGERDGALEVEIFYRESLRRWGGRFAEAVAAVADAPPGGVVVHCAGGRDRTGLVAAFLLRLADVGVGDVAADYALSSGYLEPHWRAWVDEAGDEAERARRLRRSETPADAMRNVLAALEREHGSIAGFLSSHGLDHETIARARARLR